MHFHMNNLRRVFLLIVPVLICACQEKKTNNAESDNVAKAEEYQKKGYAFYEARDYHKAIENFNRAAQLNPNDEMIFVNRGNAKDQSGDAQGAIDDYSRAIQLKPDMAMAYFNRAYVKEIRLKDVKGAMEDYELTIKYDPDHEGVFFNYALILLDLKDYEKAKKNFEEHIKHYGEDYYATYYIGLCDLGLGDSLKGMELIRQAASMENPMAVTYLAQQDSLKKVSR
jgi:tetratricopeptide (TPR) repeat protein